MSTNETKKTCVFCHAYLFEEDDVVCCPECGAPHHRECYDSLGHCALEKDHGTDNQYDKLKAREQEEAKNKKQAESSYTKNNPYANDGYTPGDEFFANFPPHMDFFGGVPADTIIDDEITAKEARNFVMSNTQRYIPKFVKLSKKKKTSWNFMAFFFPTEWLFSRKMNKKGFFVGALMLMANLLVIPLTIYINNNGPAEATSIQELASYLSKALPDIHYGILIAFFVGAALNIIVRVLFGIFGDYIYKKHVIKTVNEIKEKSDNIPADLRRKGGVNFIAFLIAYMVLNYVTNIIFLLVR